MGDNSFPSNQHSPAALFYPELPGSFGEVQNRKIFSCKHVMCCVRLRIEALRREARAAAAETGADEEGTE